MRETLTRLRQRIENSDSLDQNDQHTLLGLIGELETEASELEQHPASEKIRQAIGAAESVGKEVEDDDEGTGLVESLQDTIQGIEASHPRTAETLARIGNILGRMGI